MFEKRIFGAPGGVFEHRIAIYLQSPLCLFYPALKILLTKVIMQDNIRSMARQLIYYRTEKGVCYIEDFIDKQGIKVQRKILWTLRFLKETELLKEPYFRKMKNSTDIWECRVRFGSNIYRLFFFFDENSIVILTHGFQKKTQKTPQDEIKRAEKIQNDYFLQKRKEK